MSLTADLLKNYETEIASLTLVPGSGGAFEVSVNGEPVFSKLQLGRHAQGKEVIEAVGKKLRG